MTDVVASRPNNLYIRIHAKILSSRLPNITAVPQNVITNVVARPDLCDHPDTSADMISIGTVEPRKN
jgi:hypothetical protein